MANIRLKELVEANIDPKLTARSKETGKLVYFKTPQAKDKAMKAGTHEDPKAKKGGEPKADAKPNDMFGGDYAKDRGDEPKTSSKLTSMLPKSDSGIKEKTNRDIQIDTLWDKKEAAENEWDYQHRQYQQAISNLENPKDIKQIEAWWEKIDIPLQRKSNAIQKQIDDLQPSTIAFGKKTQKAVSDWFDANKIPYELKAGSNDNTPELQFDSKDLPKDKVKELVKLAKHVQKEDGIGIDGDLDSTLYIK